MLYFDMDGVLAKWNTEASLEDTFLPGYFASREEETRLIMLVRMLSKSYPVAILSAAYQTGTALKDKKQWLNEHGLEDIPAVFVPYGQPKRDYIETAGKHILIDDFSKNLHEWEDAGHVGIKFYNGINGNHGSWRGYEINHNQTVETMYTIVRAVAESVG